MLLNLWIGFYVLVIFSCSEVFTLTDGSDGGDDSSVTAFTLTGNYKLDSNLNFIVEARMDDSDDGIIEGTTEDSMSTLTFAAVYNF